MSDEESPAVPQAHAPRGPLKSRKKRKPMDILPPMEGLSYVPCTAKSKQSGVRCKRRPIPGGAVCVMHGGGTPSVQFNAMERLKAMQQPALYRLSQLVEQQDFPSVAYQATKDVLDRTMGKPAELVNMKVSGELSIVDRLVAARKRLSERKE
jgi:hypothetical protein